MEVFKVELKDISGSIINAAMEVHTVLGPGLLESTYEKCLKHELSLRKLTALSQVTLPINYKNKIIDEGYRLDLLVENQIIVELKTVEKFIPLHEAQLLSYLKMSNKKVGLLINFNVTRLKYGIKRIIN